MDETKNEQTEATIIQPNPDLVVGAVEVEPEAPSADAPIDPVEALARKAYAKLQKEMEFKGDFPAWESVSDRGRQLYIEAVDHIQKAEAAGRAAKAVIEHELYRLEVDGMTVRVTPKPRTHFEQIVVEVLNG